MNKLEFLKSNPFTIEHAMREAEFLNLPDMFHMDGESKVMIDKVVWKAGFRQDCYLDLSTRPKTDFTLYRFLIDGKLWMSTVPREFCSQWIALMQATGKVGVAGLGMGYFALRVASFDDVTEVVVHELNPTVIQYFKFVFKDRPEMKKIRIVQGDFEDLWKQENFDYYFNDVYLSIGTSEHQLEHMKESMNRQNIKKYWYWGFDHHLYECLKDGRMSALEYIIDQPYFKEFIAYRQELMKETNILDKETPISLFGNIDLKGDLADFEKKTGFKL